MGCQGPEGPQGIQGDRGPAGPQGETGQTGPAAGLNAFGGMYHNIPESISVGPNPVQVPLAKSLPGLHITYLPYNQIKVEKSGEYHLSYTVTVLAPETSTITLAVTADGTSIPQTMIQRRLKIGEQTVLIDTTIAALEKDSIIELKLSSRTSVDLTFEKGKNASLTLIKLN